MSAEQRTELAEDRTDWAEDRTMLANERTFAGWMRTGLAAVGIGLGFQAVFRQAENTILAKSTASLFVAIGLFIFICAYQSAKATIERMECHSAEPLPQRHMRTITILFALGAIMLGIVLWLL